MYDYDDEVDDDHRHRYVVKVNDQGLLKIKAIAEEVMEKVYVMVKRLDD